MNKKLKRTQKKFKKGGAGTPEIPHMSDMPYGATGEVLDPLLESMDCKSRVQWCMTNKGYCDDEKIQDMYIKPCKAQTQVFKENMSNILQFLDSKSIAALSSVNKNRREQFLQSDIQEKHIIPGKLMAKNNRTIEAIIQQNTDDFIDIPLYDFYFNSNYNFGDYLQEILLWSAQIDPIRPDFPWQQIVNIVIISYATDMDRIRWFDINMDLVDFFEEFSKPPFPTYFSHSRNIDRFTRCLKRTRQRMMILIHRSNLQVNTMEYYMVFQRSLDALLIGSQLTQDFVSHKMDSLLANVKYSDSDDYDLDDY
tara:strand:+ start:13 stop:939 length:927 start_codon:yes stop_codon:yes gene_type:complete